MGRGFEKGREVGKGREGKGGEDERRDEKTTTAKAAALIIAAN